METISAKFTERDAELMESFIKRKYFLNKSDLIRTAVRHYLNEEMFHELMGQNRVEPLTKDDIDKINREIRKIRKRIWEDEFKNVRSAT